MSRIEQSPESAGTELQPGSIATDQSRPDVVRIWAATTTVGWLLGLVEALVKSGRLAAGSPAPMGYDILYVAPIVYGAVASAYAACALTLWKVGSRVIAPFAEKRPWVARAVRLAPVVIAIGPVTFAFFGFLFRMAFTTALYAEILLIGGLAIQTTRIFAIRPSFVRTAARMLAPSVALTLAVAFVVNGGRWLGERRALSALPPATRTAPNVLFITLDTVRADHLSAYGSPRPTPNIDRLAGESTLFEYAIAPSSWTLPTHASLFTGRRVSEHLADMNLGERFDDRFPSVTEVFAQHGYATGAFVANQEYCNASRGFGRGFAHFEDVFHNLPSTLGETEIGTSLLESKRLGGESGRRVRVRMTGDDVNRDFLDWLPSVGDRPFFAWLNYIDVHQPYFAPPPFDRKYGERPANGIMNSWYNPNRQPKWAGAENPRIGRQFADAYDCALAYLDTAIGRLHDELKERNLLDNTIVVVTSDHGEAFGEHGIYDHSNSLYRELLHVPLFIRYPAKMAPGARYDAPVDLCNLPATMLHLADVPNGGAIPGKPIDGAGDAVVISELMHNPYQRPFYQASRGDVVSVVTSEWHAIFFVGGAHLFARSDAREQTDLAETDPGRATLNELRRELAVALPGRAIPE